MSKDIIDKDNGTSVSQQTRKRKSKEATNTKS